MCTKTKHPASVKLIADKNYAWCTCGLSKRLAFCDGKHGAIGMQPLIFSVPKTGTYKLCNCQLTNNEPFCDKSHPINHE